jgi:hypothetical protein
MARLTITDFRDELKARGFDGFSPTELDRYINFAYFDVARQCRWTWEKVVDNFTLAVGEYFVDLSTITRFKNLDTVVIDTPEAKAVKLEPVSDEEWKSDWLPFDLPGGMTSGTPNKYYITRNRLYVLPPVDSAGLNFVVSYWQRMEEMSGTVATPITPEDLDEVILLGAEIRCHRRARQLTFAREAFVVWLRQIQDILSEENLQLDEEFERALPDIR